MERFQGYWEEEWISIQKALLNPRQAEVEGKSIVIHLTIVIDWRWGGGSLITFGFCYEKPTRETKGCYFPKT